MKKTVCFLLMALLLVVFTGCSGTQQKTAAEPKKAIEQPDRIGVIVGTEVNMRKGPGTNYESLGVFTDGEKVRMLQSKGYWTEVERENKQKAWILNYFLVEYVYGKDKTMPEVILYQPDHAYPDHDIKPKKEFAVKAAWKFDSPETGKIRAEERAEVLEHKAVVRPKGTVTYQGKNIYVLTPNGAGFHLYYADGKVKRLIFDKSGHQIAENYIPGWSKAYEETEAGGKGHSYWIRVKGKNAEGWFNLQKDSYQMFYSEKGSGMFLTKPKKNQ